MSLKKLKILCNLELLKNSFKKQTNIGITFQKINNNINLINLKNQKFNKIKFTQLNLKYFKFKTLNLKYCSIKKNINCGTFYIVNFLKSLTTQEFLINLIELLKYNKNIKFNGFYTIVYNKKNNFFLLNTSKILNLNKFVKTDLTYKPLINVLESSFFWFKTAYQL
jgi:hypothetical protein